MLGKDNCQRLVQSVKGETVDGQPYFLFMDAPFMCSLVGTPLEQYYGDARTMLDVQVEAHRRLGLSGFVYPDYGVVPECVSLGAQVKRDDIGIMSVKPIRITSFEEAIRLRPADPAAGNMMTAALETMAFMLGHAPDGFQVHPTRIMAPFTAAAMLTGITDFCIDLYDEEGKTVALLELLLENAIGFVREQERLLGRLDYVLLADDLSSFLSVDLFRKYVAPYYERFYHEFPKAHRCLHNDATAAHLASEIAASGFAAWHVGSAIDIIEANKSTGGRLSLIGNLNPVECLLKGTPESVTAEADDLMDRFNGNSRFILSAGGYLCYGTPLDNVLALIGAAKARTERWRS